jgi:hypothetical protein
VEQSVIQKNCSLTYLNIRTYDRDICVMGSGMRTGQVIVCMPFPPKPVSSLGPRPTVSGEPRVPKLRQDLEARPFSAGNAPLQVRVSTHGIDRPGAAGANGVTEATCPLRDHRYGPIGSTHNCAPRIERRCGPEIDHNLDILGRCMPSQAHTRVSANRRVIGVSRNIRIARRAGPAAGSVDLRNAGRTDCNFS